MELQLKKETKHTVVYATEDLNAAVSSVYVSKSWLDSFAVPGGDRFPKAIRLEITPK